MSEWNNVIDAIERLTDHDWPMKGRAAAADLIRQAISSELTRETLARFRSDVLSVRDTGSIYENFRAAVLFERGPWRVTVGRYASESRFASTTACVSACMKIAGRGEAYIERWRISGAVRDFSTRASWHLEDRRLEPMKEGALVILDSPFEPVLVRGKSLDQEFLRITGRAQHPLVYGFNVDTGSFAYSTYASDEFTARAFFLDLVQSCLTQTSLLRDLSHDHRSEIASYLCRRAADAYIDDSVLWKIIQVVGRLDGNIALAMLRENVNHPNAEISARARRLSTPQPH